MRQRAFENRHRARWEAFAGRLESLERRRAAPAAALPSAEFPAAYRQLCQQLAVARQRQYSRSLSEHLNQLALRGYQQLYRAPANRLVALLEFIGAGFPRLVRQEAGLFWLCAGLFYGPLLVMAWVVYATPEMIYSLLDYEAVKRFEEMYREDLPGAGNRPAQSDVLMLGFYIHHNIGIGFRTFAAGIAFGVGSVFVLVMNGLFIGALSGYATAQELTETFYPFVIGHGAFELTGIVLAGVAGLKLGLALVAPGRYRRLHALRRAAATSIRLVYGVVGLLLLAAFIEAFWSSNQALPQAVKYTVGGAGWLTIILYLSMAGRRAA